MKLDENQLRYVFSAKNIKTYFRILTLLVLGLLSVLIIVTTHVFNSNKEFYYNRLASTEQYKTNDIRLLCSIIGCESAYIKEGGYIYKYEIDTGNLVKVT